MIGNKLFSLVQASSPTLLAFFFIVSGLLVWIPFPMVDGF